jgi:hypothetical protein
MNKGLVWLTRNRVPACNNTTELGLPDPVPTPGGRNSVGSSKTSKGTGGAIISCAQAVAGLVMLATVYSFEAAAGPLSSMTLTSCHLSQPGT